MRRSTAVLLIVWFALVGIVFYLERPQGTPTTPTTTVPALDCVAVTINVKTGVQTETPAPCHRGGTGCTSSITATINEDGTVAATCVPGSGNPAGQ
jgi:hypothetical protein